jgi:hypothetical protein
LVETEQIAKPSRFVRALIHWRLTTFLVLLVLVPVMLLITMTAGDESVCGCGDLSEDELKTNEVQFFGDATAAAAIPTPLPSATAAPTGGLLWPKPTHR